MTKATSRSNEAEFLGCTTPEQDARLIQSMNLGEYGLALNLFDLERVEDVIKQRLSLREALDFSPAAVIRAGWMGEREAGIPFRCDLLKAALIADLLRSFDRQEGREPTKVYLRRGETWKRTASSAVLTVVAADGQIVPNPAIFLPPQGEGEKPRERTGCVGVAPAFRPKIR